MAEDTKDAVNHLESCLKRIEEIRGEFYALPPDTPTETYVKVVYALPMAKDALEDAVRKLVDSVNQLHKWECTAGYCEFSFYSDRTDLKVMCVGMGHDSHSPAYMTMAE